MKLHFVKIGSTAKITDICADDIKDKLKTYDIKVGSVVKVQQTYKGSCIISVGARIIALGKRICDAVEAEICA